METAVVLDNPHLLATTTAALPQVSQEAIDALGPTTEGTVSSYMEGNTQWKGRKGGGIAVTFLLLLQQRTLREADFRRTLLWWEAINVGGFTGRVQ